MDANLPTTPEIAPQGMTPQPEQPQRRRVWPWVALGCGMAILGLLVVFVAVLWRFLVPPAVIPPEGPSVTVDNLVVTVTGYESLGNGDWRIDIAVTNTEAYELDDETWIQRFDVEDASGTVTNWIWDGPEFLYGGDTVDGSLYPENLAAAPLNVVYDTVYHIPLEEQ